MAAVETVTPRIPEWTTGERMAKARRDAGLTQKQIADQLGVSEKTVAAWEVGRNQPRSMFARLQQWAQITEVDLDWLKGSRTGSVALAAVPLTDAEQMELDLLYEERRRPTVVRF